MHYFSHLDIILTPKTPFFGPITLQSHSTSSFLAFFSKRKGNPEKKKLKCMLQGETMSIMFVDGAEAPSTNIKKRPKTHLYPKNTLFRPNFFGIFFDQHFSCVLQQKNRQTRKKISKIFQKFLMGGGIANGKLYKANRGNFFNFPQTRQILYQIGLIFHA